MFCPKCGKDVPNGSAFCTNCGVTLANPSAASDVSPNRVPLAKLTTKASNIFIFSLLSIVLHFCCAGFFALIVGIVAKVMLAQTPIPTLVSPTPAEEAQLAALQKKIKNSTTMSTIGLVICLISVIAGIAGGVIAFLSMGM